MALYYEEPTDPASIVRIQAWAGGEAQGANRNAPSVVVVSGPRMAESWVMKHWLEAMATKRRGVGGPGSTELAFSGLGGVETIPIVNVGGEPRFQHEKLIQAMIAASKRNSHYVDSHYVDFIVGKMPRKLNAVVPALHQVALQCDHFEDWCFGG